MGEPGEVVKRWTRKLSEPAPYVPSSLEEPLEVPGPGAWIVEASSPSGEHDSDWLLITPLAMAVKVAAQEVRCSWPMPPRARPRSNADVVLFVRSYDNQTHFTRLQGRTDEAGPRPDCADGPRTACRSSSPGRVLTACSPSLAAMRATSLRIGTRLAAHTCCPDRTAVQARRDGGRQAVPAQPRQWALFPWPGPPCACAPMTRNPGRPAPRSSPPIPSAPRRSSSPWPRMPRSANGASWSTMSRREPVPPAGPERVPRGGVQASRVHRLGGALRQSVSRQPRQGAHHRLALLRRPRGQCERPRHRHRAGLLAPVEPLGR